MNLPYAPLRPTMRRRPSPERGGSYADRDGATNDKTLHIVRRPRRRNTMPEFPGRQPEEATGSSSIDTVALPSPASMGADCPLNRALARPGCPLADTWADTTTLPASLSN